MPSIATKETLLLHEPTATNSSDQMSRPPPWRQDMQEREHCSDKNSRHTPAAEDEDDDTLHLPLASTRSAGSRESSTPSAMPLSSLATTAGRERRLSFDLRTRSEVLDALLGVCSDIHLKLQPPEHREAAD
jgi:hypothetical protein